MVNYMKAAFGDKLLSQPLQEDFDQLPSPEARTCHVVNSAKMCLVILLILCMFVHAYDVLYIP